MTTALTIAWMLATAAPEPSPLIDALPASVELSLADQWASRAFDAPAMREGEAPFIRVLANNDPVQIDRRNDGGLNISGAPFDRGLYVHAVSDLRVTLPSPAARFSAWVGVHSNAQTSGGRGSIVFVVEADGGEVYRSELMREGAPAVLCDVALDGATELALKVEDGGDGISCDQGVWAEPIVTCGNGETIRLNLLPLHGSQPTILPDLPFSFCYGGASSRDFLVSWPREVGAPERIADGVVQQDIVWSAPDSGLRVRCELTRYEAFPTVEWIVWFENEGDADTPLIEAVRAFDGAFSTAEGAPAPVLRHNRGTQIAATDFEPLTTPLSAGETARFGSPQGRPTAVDWPYYNLSLPDHGGAIVIVGWPGTWFAEFCSDPDGTVRLEAGQETTRFVVRPGERLRSARMVVQIYQGGDDRRAQNMWRRWMLAHNVPRPEGDLPSPLHAACSSHQYAEMIHANEANQKMFVDRYLERGMPLDYWWMDAGWYPCDGSWPKTGTWEVDTERFPRGLRAVSDHAHGRGVDIIVWFEPERVAPGTWLDTERPQWVLRADGHEWGLLNLGDPEAWSWLVDHIDSLIGSQGIDLYRQDFNMDPLPHWRAQDAEDRQGVTENLYVQGYLAYWDALLQRHPGMLIDTCASGGHRLDIETLRRSIPLLRSDYILEPMGQQGHTYGLAEWVPVFGTGVNRTDAYGFRSQMCPTINTCYDMRPDDADFSEAAALVRQWRGIAPYYAGDFHRLSPYAVDGSGIMAWQFNRPEQGDGMVQAFRQDACIYRALDLRLQGLDPDASYRCTDLDSGREETLLGRALMQDGMPLELARPETAVIVTYSRVDR